VFTILVVSLLMGQVLNNWRPEDSMFILMLVIGNGESEDHGRRRTKFLNFDRLQEAKFAVVSVL
jgi:hypothetical protein